MILSDGSLLLAYSKGCGAFEGIGESVPADREGLGNLAARFYSYVEDPDRGVGEFLDAVCAVALAAYDFDGDIPVIDLNCGYLSSSQISVTRFALLQLFG